MANHIEPSLQIPRGAELIQRVKSLRSDANYFRDLLPIMTAMISGDSGQAASYLPIAIYYGIQGTDDTAKGVSAKLLYDELNSTVGNALTHAALLQFLAELG